MDKRVKAGRSALSAALRDLNSEIRILSKEKADLKKKFKQTTSTIDSDRQLEKSLQQKIAKIIDKESRLNEEKKKLELRIENVSDKITKISKVRSEMADI